MSLPRACIRTLLFGGLTLFGFSSASAQVVIRERVEVDPAQPDSTAGPVSAPAPVAYAWPGGVRGRGEYVVRVLSASNYTLGPTADGELLIETSHGDTETRALSAVTTLAEERFYTCAGGYRDRYFDGDGQEWRVRVEADELVWLRFVNGTQSSTAGTAAVWTTYHLRHLHCPWADVTIQTVFEADPPDELRLTMSPDTLEWGSYAVANVLAVYESGEQAPLADTTSLTFGVSAVAGVMLEYPATGQVGTTISGVPYRSGGYYASLKVVTDESVPGPVCDTPVSVTVTGGGLSGEATVVIRGSSTSTELDTLAVTASPGILGPNEQAALSAVAVTAGGCEGGGLPANTPMSFSVEDDHYGVLAYGSEQGTTIDGVPYSEAEAGVVLYDRNGREPYYDWPVQMDASGGGLTGTGEVLVDGSYEIQPCSTGNAMLDDERVQDGLMRLWAAATLGERGRRVSVDARLEFAGYIIPFVPSGYGLQVVQTYSYQNPRRAKLDISGSLLGIEPVVFVHTHPFAPSELIPTEDLQGLEPYESIHPSPGDELALKQHEDALGVNVDGLVIDAVRMLLFDEHGTRLAEFDRCGY